MQAGKVAAVRYKPPVERDTQMSRRKAVKLRDGKNLNQNWKDEVQVWHEYAGYREQYLDVLTKFQSILVDHLSQVPIPKHWAKLAPKYT